MVMRKLLTILVFLAAFSVYGQKDALYYQYMFNPVILNPAYAGVPQTLNMSVVDRYQWIGIPGAPKTLTVSAHGPLRNQKVGLGAYLYADVYGPISDYGFMGNYSYRVNFWDGKLSFGIQAGLVKRWINWDVIDMPDLDDIYLQTRPQPRVSPDVNFGVLYYEEDFFIGLSTKHLLEITFNDIVIKGNKSFSALQRHFYAYHGWMIPIHNRLLFKPEILLKYVLAENIYFDLNAFFLINKVLWVGASYRHHTKSVVLLTELNINKKLKIGYSWDTYLGDVWDYNIGTHEFLLSYTINVYKVWQRHPIYF